MKASKSLIKESAVTATVSVMILSACSADKHTIGDSETISVTEDMESTDSIPHYVFTPEGIGSITPGMRIGEWPEETNGLYTHIDNESGGEADQYNFYKDDELSFTVLDFGEGKADLIIVDNPEMDVKVGNNTVNMNTPFSLLLSNPEVKPEWEQLDDEGMWYWKVNGLWFAPSQENLTPALTDKLYNPATPPVKADFPEDVKIGYIGTGLPF